MLDAEVLAAADVRHRGRLEQQGSCRNSRDCCIFTAAAAVAAAGSGRSSTHTNYVRVNKWHGKGYDSMSEPESSKNNDSCPQSDQRASSLSECCTAAAAAAVAVQ